MARRSAASSELGPQRAGHPATSQGCVADCRKSKSQPPSACSTWSWSEKRVYLLGRTAAIGRVLKYIDANLELELSLNKAAEAAFLSPSYLSQLLKKQTGQAFVEWVTSRRLERAHELLSTADERIGAVASAVGFTDQAYFTRRFRQRYGVAPSEYRKSVRPVG